MIGASATSSSAPSSAPTTASATSSSAPTPSPFVPTSGWASAPTSSTSASTSAPPTSALATSSSAPASSPFVPTSGWAPASASAPTSAPTPSATAPTSATSSSAPTSATSSSAQAAPAARRVRLRGKTPPPHAPALRSCPRPAVLRPGSRVELIDPPPDTPLPTAAQGDILEYDPSQELWLVLFDADDEPWHIPARLLRALPPDG